VRQEGSLFSVISSVRVISQSLLCGISPIETIILVIVLWVA